MRTQKDSRTHNAWKHLKDACIPFNEERFVKLIAVVDCRCTVARENLNKFKFKQVYAGRVQWLAIKIQLISFESLLHFWRSFQFLLFMYSLLRIDFVMCIVSHRSLWEFRWASERERIERRRKKNLTHSHRTNLKFWFYFSRCTLPHGHRQTNQPFKA